MGYDNPSDQESFTIGKFFDLFVTLPAMLLEPDNDRRKMYGKAGAMRLKPYGLEMRTLSSFFASSDELLDFVFNQTAKALEEYKKGEIAIDFFSESICEAINNNSKSFIKDFVSSMNLMGV